MQFEFKAVAAAAIVLAASSASAQDAQIVKIGHVGPVSGAQAHYGKDNENGARMAIEDLTGRTSRSAAPSRSPEWPPCTA